MSQILIAGRPVAFGTEGNFRTWAGPGWSQDKDKNNFTWMEGHVAWLEFEMAVPTIDLMMVARMSPFVINEPNRQQLYIYLNGLFVDLWIPIAKEALDYSTPIRKSFFSKDSANLLAFVAPGAISPAKARLGPDQRALSFAFMQITLKDPTRRA